MKSKWKEAGVPHKGWKNINMYYDEEGTNCEMCGTEIKYVHYMEHQDYHEPIAVGCICAGKMSEDYVAAKTRNKDLVKKTIIQKKVKQASPDAIKN